MAESVEVFYCEVEDCICEGWIVFGAEGDYCGQAEVLIPIFIQPPIKLEVEVGLPLNIIFLAFYADILLKACKLTNYIDNQRNSCILPRIVVIEGVIRKGSFQS